MPKTVAKNIGVIINNPAASVTVNSDFSAQSNLASPSNIPSSKGFIGRAADLLALHEAKKIGKTSVILHGQPGVGKTELALKFISEVKSEFQANIRVDVRGVN